MSIGDASSIFPFTTTFIFSLPTHPLGHKRTDTMPGDEESPYAARPAPESFDDFMAQVSAIQEAHGGIMVDEDLYEDIFGEAP